MHLTFQNHRYQTHDFVGYQCRVRVNEICTNPNFVQWLDDKLAAQIFISSIIKAEIELGIALLEDGNRKSMLAEAAASMFKEFETRCLALNCSTSKIYAHVVADNTSSDSPISVEGAQIASIALYNNFLLATRNTRDLDKINKLKLFNPWGIA